MKINKLFGICILVLFSLTFIHEVYALGISPGRRIIDYRPGTEMSYELKIWNNEHKDMKVMLYVGGDLSNIVELSDYELDFSSDEEYKKISYKVRLPDEIEEPGDHEIQIVAGEVPKEMASRGVSMVVSLSVAAQVIIRVPYPGKYALAELKVAETNKVDEVRFIVVVNNLGTQKIVNSYGVIDIYGPTNEKIASISSEAGSVLAGEKVELNAIWDDNVNPGKYYAKLSLYYDGEVAHAEKTFEVGEPLIEMRDIRVRDFKLGEIAKFGVMVENKWSDAIEDVYTEVIIREEGHEVGRFKSSSEDIDKLSTETLVAYWDTAGVEEGVYDASVILYYEGKSTVRDMKASISLNSISFDAFGTGMVGAKFSRGSDLLIVGIIILIIINIGWFIYFRVKRRDRE
jgi:hypothetical protein